MTERLIVEDDEAHALARELAERRGVSVEEAIVASLRASLDEARPARPAPTPVRIPTLEELTPEQRADLEALRALIREAAPYIIPGASSDHRDMYDEHGLPI